MSLLDEADEMLDDPALASARWRRAVSLLYRAVLEDALEAFWRERVPELQYADGRSQLNCLVVYRPDVAAEVSFAWHSLSEMGHFRDALGPDPEEVRRQGQVVRRVVDVLQGPRLNSEDGSP